MDGAREPEGDAAGPKIDHANSMIAYYLLRKYFVLSEIDNTDFLQFLNDSLQCNHLNVMLGVIFTKRF